MKNKNGFTLIELLVVISIIGLLSTMTVYAVNVARINARDVKRKADLAILQKAVELYIAEYNEPARTGTYGESNSGSWDSSHEGGFMQFLEGSVGTANPDDILFLKNPPVDPINTGSGDCVAFVGYHYCYYYYNTPALGFSEPHYRIGTKLEKDGSRYWVLNTVSK